MSKKISLFFALLFLVSGTVKAATVTPGTYILSDHPIYLMPAGLILNVLDPSIDPGPSFSVEENGASVSLFWDGGNTATISGQVWSNELSELWTVEHILTGVAAFDTGFIATGGTLTLTDPSANVIVLPSQARIDTFAFLALADSHRCFGVPGCGPLVAQGWIGAPDVNDWLVQLTPVPIPAALPLLVTGLLALFGLARKSRF